MPSPVFTGSEIIPVVAGDVTGDGWPDLLAAHRHRFAAQRCRAFHWLTPFGQVSVPVRGLFTNRRLTRSKGLFRGKAIGLLSPALEQAACAAATEQNDRPAARVLPCWIGSRLGPWLV